MKGQVTQLFSGPTSTSENILLFREELLSMPSINYCTVGRFISSKNSQIMSAQSLSVAPLAKYQHRTYELSSF